MENQPSQKIEYNWTSKLNVIDTGAMRKTKQILLEVADQTNEELSDHLSSYLIHKRNSDNPQKKKYFKLLKTFTIQICYIS